MCHVGRCPMRRIGSMSKPSRRLHHRIRWIFPLPVEFQISIRTILPLTPPVWLVSAQNEVLVPKSSSITALTGQTGGSTVVALVTTGYYHRLWPPYVTSYHRICSWLVWPVRAERTALRSSNPSGDNYWWSSVRPVRGDNTATATLILFLDTKSNWFHQQYMVTWCRYIRENRSIHLRRHVP